MRATRIELKNFRNYEHLVLNFQHGGEPDDRGRTLIIGENGTGKSTVIDAAAYALLGRCRGVDGKGSGQKDLIRTGADAMQVTLWTDTLGPVTRGITLSGSQTSSMKPEMVLGQLLVTEGMLTAVLYGRAFFDMHHSEATAMLLKLLDVTVGRDQLPGIDLPEGVDAVDLSYLESLYDTEYQNRAALKKVLANVHVPDPPKVVAIDLGGKTLADLKAQQAAVQAVVRENQQAATRNEVAAVQLRDRIKTLEALEGGTAQITGGRDAHVNMLAEHQAQLDEAVATLKADEAVPAEPVSALQVQLNETSTLIDKIGRHTSGLAKPGKKKDEAHSCVLSADIPCLTAISEFQGQVANLKTQVKQLEDRIRAGNARSNKIAVATQAVKDAERHVTYHRNQITQADEKLKAAADAGTVLPQLRTDLADREKDAAEANRQVAAGTVAVAKLTDQVGQLAAYDQAMKAHQQGVKALADMQAQVAESERKVDLLGPNGIRKQALQTALADFEDVINAALDGFGFTLKIQAEGKGLAVRVKTPHTGESFLPYALLSDGQKLWTGLAFQLALAAVSGLDFCIIDGAEAVVGKNRGLLTGLVMGAPVGQVIVAMAKGDEEATPDIDGLQVIRAQAQAEPVAV